MVITSKIKVGIKSETVLGTIISSENLLTLEKNTKKVRTLCPLQMQIKNNLCALDFTFRIPLYILFVHNINSSVVQAIRYI